eukprot:TRINITY_DN4687_c0_g1_i1.p1 TRINITY_DN4687_c0_g1~~TRINITY_DN4687_c0_g1_i1.p1  ORF type:complete len:1292 (-),score=383.08 TRINITY_DN4687_c0_g1_i1:315-4190(-)
MAASVSFINVFETKSNRVKGVAFHPTRPWVLASLHNGVIQLWDYRIRTLVDRFGEHDGPVRSVDFHHSQPLFVSGGDDYKIKIWNYRERRCIFTLQGHLDYIRTVQFHHEYPWILSASDDQTIRIWNWQSRQCIAILTGHSHYVMCARFHPSEDLVVSASLDQTVRVWDISGLRRKNIAPTFNRDDASSQLQNEIFGSTDAIVKYVIEGHDRGVNWASFHPTQPLIISGADDRQIKLWRMNETRAWEVDTLRGHHNNVCGLLFHAKDDVMLSVSEDKTIRVWDMTKRTCVYSHRRDQDRFWVLTAHPKLNIFAAGHDNGLIVFKLNHERPPYVSLRNELLLYCKDRFIRSFHYESNRDVPVVSLRKASGNGLAPRTMSYNPKENAVLVTYKAEGGDRYELYSLPSSEKGNESESSTPPRGGPGKAAVWITRNRFAVLDKGNLILIKDTLNDTKKKITPPHSVDKIFAASPDCLLLRSDDRITLYDVVQERSVYSEVKIPNVKQVVWNNRSESSSKDNKNKDQSYSTPSLVAFICRSGLVVTNQKLDVLFSLPETMKVQSGVWDEYGTFIYSTLSHIKYALPNGDHGIVRTLDRPIYITSAKGNQIYCLDRQSKPRNVVIDTTEYMFKRALSNRRFDEVLRMVKNSNLIGQSIIGYLQKQGYPEVALMFVKDEKTRFNLALESSNARNIDIALKSAKIIDDKESWTKLGSEALRQGNHQVVEKAYQQTLDFEKLSFLYLITGNTRNLNKMLDIARDKRNDANARIQNSLLVGNVGERINVLLEQGQLQLAYMTALTHGIEDAVVTIREIIQKEHEKEHAGKAEEDIPPLVLPQALPNAKLLLPPTPIFRSDKSNWPLTRLARGPFDDVLSLEPGSAQSEQHKQAASAPTTRLQDVDTGDADGSGKWGEDDDLALSDGDDQGSKTPPEEDEQRTTKGEGDGWGEDDIGLDELEEPSSPQKNSGSEKFITLPPQGNSKCDSWGRNATSAADLAAAGKFEDAMRFLNQQVGIVNFEPLKSHFLRLYQSNSGHLLGLGSLPSLSVYLERPTTVEDGDRSSSNVGFPRLCITLQSQIEKLSNAYRAVTNGQFTEAKVLFESILHSIPLVVAQSRSEANEMKEIVGICKEYLVGIATELQRKEVSTTAPDSARALELAAYFTNCDLQPKHLQLCLKSAMNAAAKVKNYATADEFARRLLDLNPPEAVATHTNKVLRLCEQKGRSDAVELKYDHRNPFVLCSATLTPIYQGSSSLSCPYCSASYKPEFSGKLCVVCGIAEIGKSVDGLSSLLESKKKHR